jgi:medium-chain acyl-[acyl-carrier-protein] hydrolase
VEQFSTEIARMLDKPFGFYGHSMGALIAFEVAHAIRERTGLSPAHFFVSGSRAPQAGQIFCQLHALSDPEFVREVEHYGLLPPHVLGSTELMELLGPLLRADLRLCDGYRYEQRSPFDCPLTVIGCLDDPWVPAKELASWQLHTTGSFSRVMVAGGHQLGEDTATSFISVIRNKLSLGCLSAGTR